MRRIASVATLVLAAGAAGCFILVDPDDYGDAGGSGASASATGATGSTSSTGAGGGCAAEDLPADLALRFGDASDQSVLDSVVDADGNLYLLGICTGDPGFGAPVSCGPAESLYVAKLTADGGALWTKLINSPSFQGAAIAVAPSGAVWVVGGFGQSLDDVISVSGCVSQNSAGGFDGFYARFTSDGACEALERFGDASHQIATDVVSLDGDAVAIAGRFSGMSDVGMMPIDPTKTDDIVVVRLELSGMATWKADLKAANAQEPSVHLAARQGKLVVAGSFDGTADCCGGNADPGGNRDIVVAALDPVTGAIGASRLFGGAGEEILFDVVVDDSGAPSILGSFDSLDLPIGSTALQASGASPEMFLAGLDPQMKTTFARDEGGTVLNGALALDPKSSDLAFAVTAAGLDDGPSDTGYDAYAGLVGCGGEVRWLDHFGDVDAQAAGGISFAPDGGLMLTGAFISAIEFPPLTPPLSSNGGSPDVFIAHFARP